MATLGAPIVHAMAPRCPPPLTAAAAVTDLTTAATPEWTSVMEREEPLLLLGD